jgi:hypothetical protein
MKGAAIMYKCILCNHETQAFRHEKFDVTYYRCFHCELISKDSKDFVSEDEALKIYNYHNNAIEDSRYVAYFNHFLEDSVFDYTNEGKKAFDFGSGPSPVLAQILERHYGYDVDIYDLFYAPDKVYENQKYDLVTTTEVVEHLENPLPYFELFASLLKPDGVLAVMTQFHKNDDDLFLNWHYMRDMSHISFYTPKTMAYIASKVGLKVVYTDGNRYTTFRQL